MRGERTKKEMNPWSEDKEVHRPPTPEEAKAIGERLDELGIKDEDLRELKEQAEKEDMQELAEEIDTGIEVLDKALKGRPDSVEKTHVIDLNAEKEIAEEYGPGDEGIEKAADEVKGKIMQEVKYLKRLTKTASKEELAAIEEKLKSRMGAVAKIDDHLERLAKNKLDRAELGQKQSQAQEQRESTKKPTQAKGVLGRISGIFKKK